MEGQHESKQQLWRQNKAEENKKLIALLPKGAEVLLGVSDRGVKAVREPLLGLALIIICSKHVDH